MVEEKRPKVLFLSAYPPTQSGLAGYTKALVEEMRGNRRIECSVMAVGERNTQYGGDVVGHFRQDSRFAHLAAAEMVNESGADVLMVQHHFGLYGGLHGEYLLDLMERIDLPTMVACHMVPQEPSDQQRNILADICYYSEAVVAMCASSKLLLQNTYGVDGGKILAIPPGVPPPAALQREDVKRAYNLAGRCVVSSCGPIAPGRGLEHAIEAVALLARRNSDIRYLIWGQPAAGMDVGEAEKYRDGLLALAERFGAAQNVMMRCHAPSLREMSTLMSLSDMVLMPCLAGDWATCSALACAMVAGRVVIATPFRYARDLLSEGRGILAAVSDAPSLARCMQTVMENPTMKTCMEDNARRYGNSMQLPAVCRRQEDAFIKVANQNTHRVVS